MNRPRPSDLEPRTSHLAKIASFREFGTLILLILVVLFATIKEPRFLDPSNLSSILLWIPLLAIVGMGQMLVIVTRGIDVSVGSMVGLSGMVAGLFYRSQPGTPVFFGVLVAIGVGLILGSINAAVIAWGKVPPIIATLGTLSAYRGLVFIVSKGEQVDTTDLPPALTSWSLEGPLTLGKVTIPWILVMTILVALAAAYFVRSTRAGRNVYALGSHPEAARLRGVPVTRTTFLVYAITGALSGLAGVLYASRYGFVNPTAGSGMELIVIAAVVIGGTKVSGGSGTVLGVLLGCLLLGSINVALAVLGIAATWQMLVYGLLILIALVVDMAIQRSLTKWGGSVA